MQANPTRPTFLPRNFSPGQNHLLAAREDRRVHGRLNMCNAWASRGLIRRLPGNADSGRSRRRAGILIVLGKQREAEAAMSTVTRRLQR